MTLTDAEIVVLNRTLAEFVPVFYSGKGYERDAVKAVAWDDEIVLTVENPWAGNTGYGSKSSIGLDAEAARGLGIWLLAAALAKAGAGTKK